MVGRRDGILVFPAPPAGAGECFGEPVARAGVCDLGVEIEGALLLARGELGLVERGGAAVAEGVEEGC